MACCGSQTAPRDHWQQGRTKKKFKADQTVTWIDDPSNWNELSAGTIEGNASSPPGNMWKVQPNSGGPTIYKSGDSLSHAKVRKPRSKTTKPPNQKDAEKLILASIINSWTKPLSRTNDRSYLKYPDLLKELKKDPVMKSHMTAIRSHKKGRPGRKANVTPKHVQAFFNKLDADRNGTIDLSEWTINNFEGKKKRWDSMIKKVATLYNAKDSAYWNPKIEKGKEALEAHNAHRDYKSFKRVFEKELRLFTIFEEDLSLLYAYADTPDSARKGCVNQRTMASILKVQQPLDEVPTGDFVKEGLDDVKDFIDTLMDSEVGKDIMSMIAANFSLIRAAGWVAGGFIIGCLVALGVEEIITIFIPIVLGLTLLGTALGYATYQGWLGADAANLMYGLKDKAIKLARKNNIDVPETVASLFDYDGDGDVDFEDLKKAVGGFPDAVTTIFPDMPFLLVGLAAGILAVTGAEGWEELMQPVEEEEGWF